MKRCRAALSLFVALGCFITACSGSNPTGPSQTLPPKPMAVVQVGISPNPVIASLLSVSGTSATYRIQGTVTFQETAGTSATITQVNATVVLSAGGNMPGYSS